MDRDFKLSAIINHSPEVLSMKDVEGRYVLANPNLQRIHHLSEHEIIGKTDSDLYPREIASRLTANDRKILQSLQRQSVEECLPVDGELRIFMTTIFPVLNPDGIVQFICRISLDITESKKKNDALFESEARLQEAHQLAKMGDWTWDIHTNTHFWSKETYQIYGLSPQLSPLDYPTVANYYTKKSWRQLSKVVNNAMMSGEAYECDAEIIRKDGTHCWITTRGKGVFNDDGKVIRLHGTIQDITERKEAEINLQIAAVAFESQDSIMITDTSLNILNINKAFTETFGYTAEEVIGRNAKVLHSGIQDITFDDEMWNKINSVGVWKGEILNRHKSGKLLYNLFSITAVKSEDNVVTHYVGSHVDITELKAGLHPFY